MIIYLDILILYNALINAFILYLSAHFNKIKIKISLLIISALTGAITSVAILLRLPLVLSNISKLITPLIMSKICIKRNTMKLYIKFLITYFLLTFILSGITICIKYALSPTNKNEISIIATICSLLFLAVFHKKLLDFYNKNFKNYKNYAEVTIYHKGVTLVLCAFNDSGNSLVYGNEEIPVFICDYKTIEPITENNSIRYDFIKCCTITENSTIKIFEPDSISVNGENIRAIIGISPVLLNTDYDILINLENIKIKETEINYV